MGDFITRKIVVLFTILLFCVTFLIKAETENSLALTFLVYKNYTISVKSIEYTAANPLLPRREGSYKLDVVDDKGNVIFSQKFDVEFIILSEPPEETNESLTYMRIPWNENYFKINFYHNGTLIYVVSLSDYICNKNGLCEKEKGETPINCPNDCLPTTTTTLPSIQPTFPFYYILAIIAFIAVILFFLLTRIKVQRSEGTS